MATVEEREHAVVIDLSQRVVFVVMALATLKCQTKHRLTNSVHTIKHRLHTELFRINSALLVDHRVAKETGCNERVLGRIWQQVTRDLLDDKAVIWQVSIERSHDPVAVEPDETRLVLFEAIRVRVSGRVEPVPCPLFAVVR